MKLDSLLLQELEKYFSNAAILFISRAKLYIFTEAESIWGYNSEGWILVLRDKSTEIVSIVLMNCINMEILFEMEHYTNMTQYSKSIPQSRFFIFLAPTNYVAMTFGFCFDAKQEVLEFKKVLETVQLKEQAESMAPKKQQQNILETKQSRRILQKAAIDQKLLQNNLLFRQNVINILVEADKFKSLHMNVENKNKFRTLALDTGQKVDVKQQYDKQYEEQIVKKLIQEWKQEKIRNKN